jgi:outer membrane lipoprotein LolB
MSGRWAALALVVALGGCRTLPAPPAPDAAARATLATLSDWHASGRVAVRSADQGFSASFDWRERDGRGELGVRGPFGAGAVRITRSSAAVVIDSGNGPPLEVPAPFDTLEAELIARLGFPLPLESLRFWVLGVPEPGQPAAGDGGEFRQDGWLVTPSEFQAVPGAPGPLPGRLVLVRESTRIRVVIDHWQVGAGS